MATNTGVRIVRRGLPAFDVALKVVSKEQSLTVVSVAYLAVNELEIPGALGITVTSSVLGASLVGGVLLQTAVSIHGDKVQRTVEATWQVR